MSFLKKLAGPVLEHVGFQQNRREAKRAWNRQMRASNTAYQRATADMRAAGLNPILALKFGPSTTPSAAMANVDYAGSATTGYQIQQMEASTGLAEAQTSLTESRDALNKALIPGAEGIAEVTKQLAGIAKAVTEIIGNDAQGYKELLGQASQLAADWLIKAREVGLSASDAIYRAMQEYGLTPREKNWLDESTINISGKTKGVIK